MDVLKQMDEILNSKRLEQPVKKKVTFKDPIPEPRVNCGGDMQISP